ncbi:serine/threonine protein kinase [Gordonia alkaliphila]|uniref:serine/threonine-protein kinase n=1 Tax=Gordonia alkaliphila TaxID=1053547 RepID=UPI001FF30BBF|nr:serine/threonine-protein kinase [Gordonia alkaliphila]MCK0439839.1 serine/threonine protein kinase [Gordonia alkaliphila]
MTVPGDRSGTMLGPYRLVRLLGRGGMGEVYEAVDTAKDRTVALKLLPPQLAHDDEYRTRFLRESQTAARLSDPHVIPIHDFGEIDGQLFLDMRIVDGQDLRALIRQGPVPADQAVAIIEQIAGALDTAHQAGLTHRDVKPENILLDRRGFAYLVDFGLVQSAGQTSLTSTGSAIGSFNYMAPERFGTGAPVGPPADVYALTCVLYECLTGAKPFGDDSMEQIIAGHLHRPLPPTGGPLDAVIAHGTAKDPAQRFASAGALATAARQTLNGRPPVLPHATTQVAPVGALGTLPPQPPISPQPVPPQGSNRSMNLVLAGIAAVAVFAAVGTAIALWPSGNDDDPDLAATSVTTTIEAKTTTITESAADEPSTTATSAPSRTTTTLTPTSTRGTGDLGLSTPITTPSCTGETVTFVFNAITPGAYAQEVAAALQQHPGASYLRTDQACASLKQSQDGNPIYAVYYPGATVSETCAIKSRIGGGSYSRRLDHSTAVGTEIC